MEWLNRLFRRKAKASMAGRLFRTSNLLFSDDGKRKVEVREFDDGKTYLLESDWAEGDVFVDRHAGQMVGPFKSPKHAERFVVATPWFTGQES